MYPSRDISYHNLGYGLSFSTSVSKKTVQSKSSINAQWFLFNEKNNFFSDELWWYYNEEFLKIR